MIFSERVEEAQRIGAQEIKQYEQKKKSKSLSREDKLDTLMNKKNNKLEKNGVVSKGKKIKKQKEREYFQ